MNEVEIFINRMKRIGIELELKANYPWIYLHSVNGNRVKQEDWSSHWGYTIAWLSIKPIGAGVYLDEDIKRTFEVIRKYI
jgi:hypothetical protein